MRIGMRTTLFIITLLMMAVLLAAAPSHAQGTAPVEVRVVITQVRAENLNEDSITDDGEDEMLFFYALYEVGDDGRVLQVSDGNTEYFFNDEERALGSVFAELRLVVNPANRAVFIMYAVEVDTPVTDEDAISCGTDGSEAVVACLMGGDCGDLSMELVEQCINELGSSLVASNDDLFENAHVNVIDLATLTPELADVDIRDVGTNSAEYEVEYTIVRSASTETPIRQEDRHYLYFGRLESGADRASWDFSLAIGETLTMRATPYSDNLDTALRLTDSSGVIVAENDDAENFDTLNAILEYTARLGGDFTLELFRGNGATEGNYFVEIIVQ